MSYTPFNTQKVSRFLRGCSKHRDSGWSWIVCFSVFGIFLCSSGFVLAHGLIYTQLLEEFKQSRGKTAIVGSLVNGLRFTFAPIAGIIVTKIGIRMTVVTGAILISISLLTTSFCNSLECMIGTFSVVYAFGAGICYAASMASLSFYFVKYVSLATGMAASGSSLGPVVLTPPLRYIMDKYGWRHLFRILSVIFGVMCLCGGLSILPTKEEKRQRTFKADDQYSATKFAPIRRYLAQLKKPRNLVFFFSMFVLGFSSNVLFLHQVQFSIETGIDLKDASNLLIFMGCASTCGRVCFGLSMDRRIIDVIKQYQCLLVIAGVISICAFNVQTYKQLIVYCVFVNFFEGALQGLIFVMTLEVNGRKNIVQVWTMNLFFISAASSLGPMLTGVIVDATENYRMLFFVASGPPLLCAIILFGLELFPREDDPMYLKKMERKHEKKYYFLRDVDPKMLVYCDKETCV